MPNALTPDTPLPNLVLSTLSDGEVKVGKPNRSRGDWQLVVVYRGKHCPICKSYLTELNGMLDDFAAIGIDVLAISADTEEKAKASAATSIIKA